MKKTNYNRASSDTTADNYASWVLAMLEYEAEKYTLLHDDDSEYIQFVITTDGRIKEV